LRSRVCACPLIAITEPDDALLSAVIVKHFADRHLTPSPETVKYIVARMERSMEQAGIIAARLDRLSLAERRPVTRALAATLFANEAMVEDENVA
jgi:chromosomal replication initiation ATPase DnaA